MVVLNEAPPLPLTDTAAIFGNPVNPGTQAKANPPDPNPHIPNVKPEIPSIGPYPYPRCPPNEAQPLNR